MKTASKKIISSQIPSSIDWIKSKIGQESVSKAFLVTLLFLWKYIVLNLNLYIKLWFWIWIIFDDSMENYDIVDGSFNREIFLKFLNDCKIKNISAILSL